MLTGLSNGTKSNKTNQIKKQDELRDMNQHTTKGHKVHCTYTVHCTCMYNVCVCTCTCMHVHTKSLLKYNMCVYVWAGNKIKQHYLYIKIKETGITTVSCISQ